MMPSQVSWNVEFPVPVVKMVTVVTCCVGSGRGGGVGCGGDVDGDNTGVEASECRVVHCLMTKAGTCRRVRWDLSGARERFWPDDLLDANTIPYKQYFYCVTYTHSRPRPH